MRGGRHVRRVKLVHLLVIHRGANLLAAQRRSKEAVRWLLCCLYGGCRSLWCLRRHLFARDEDSAFAR